MSFKKTGSGLEKITERLDRLSKMHLLVGIPADHESRSGEPINNAALGYIHEMGNPKQGIPARPFLRPGLRKAKGKMCPHLAQSLRNALLGGDPREGLERAGMIAASSVKNMFTDNKWPEVSDAAILSRVRRRESPASRKRRLGDKKRFRGELAGKAKEYPRPVKPLVDTGQLRNSITYVVEE